MTTKDNARFCKGKWYSDTIVLHLLNEMILRLPRALQVIESVAFTLNGSYPIREPLECEQRIVLPCFMLNHWSVLFMWITSKKQHTNVEIFHVDSMPSTSRLDNLKLLVERYIDRSYDTKSKPAKYTFTPVACQLQANSDDCGVHTVRNIEHILRLPRTTFTGTVNALRKN